jgi:chromate reductase
VTHVLLISGSLRNGSTNTATLRTIQAIAPSEISADLYDGMGRLPHFNPDADREGDSVHPEVARLRERSHAADAAIVCTPEYAGALPGALKNLLAWTVGDASTYRKPVHGSMSPVPPRRPAVPTRTSRCARSWDTSTPTSSSPPACGCL